MSAVITVVMADDHTILRQSLLSELAKHTRIRIVGEAAHGKELLTVIREKDPEVVILDLSMPVMNGEETFSIIKKEHPAIKVIILSHTFNTTLVGHYITRGAGAFLSKNHTVEVLIEAIIRVYDSGYYLKTLDTLPGDSKEYTFSNIELDIIRGISLGKTNKQMAEELHRSPNTIDYHRKNIYGKAEVNSSSQLILFAARNGLISVHNNLFL